MILKILSLIIDKFIHYLQLIIFGRLYAGGLEKHIINNIIDQKFCDNFDLVEENDGGSYIAKLNCATFYGPRGLCVINDKKTNSRKVVIQACGGLYKNLTWGSSRSNYMTERYRRPITIEDSAIFIPNNGFYHFLVEDLPKIISVIQTLNSTVQIVLTPATPKYIRQYLTILVENPRLPKFTIVTVSTPVTLTKTYFVTEAEADISFVTQNINIGTVYHADKIYISRRKTHKRKIANELEIERFFIDNGWSVMYLEEMSVREQIEVFRSAKYIVSPHGAGLSNLIWCARLTELVEIFNSDHDHDCFKRLMPSRTNYQKISCKKVGKNQILDFCTLQASLDNIVLSDDK